MTLLPGLGEFLGVFWLNASIAGAPILAALFLMRRVGRGIHPRVLHLLAAAMPFAVVLMAARASTAAPEGVEAAGAIAVSYEALVDPRYVSLIWCSIAAFLFVREAGGAVRLARVRRQWMPAASLGVDVWTAPSGTPMTVGLLRPVVLMPERILRELTPDAVRSIILHELHHARCHDPLVHALVRMIRILCWPVLPLAGFEWLARRLAEESADRAALRGAAPAVYAESLVRVAAWSSAPAATAMALTTGSLEERIRRIFEPGRLSLRRAAAIAMIAILAAGALDALPVAFADAPPALLTAVSGAVVRSVVQEVVRTEARMDISPPPGDEVVRVVKQTPPPERIRHVIRIRN
ncbi:MAG TPA: M56 family metallopeptidase [Thermoanaerobaculia bacterium]|nr:M56 family metallopeptidase [Thermoanaerobaculia bacterium]